MRKLLVVFTAAVAIPTLIAGALLALPTPRYQLLRVLTELPGVATFFATRRALQSRDYDAAARSLQWQLDLDRQLNVHRTKLLPSLINHTETVVDSARLREERLALRPFLESLVSAYPDHYLARLWLGQVLAQLAPEEALRHLEIAARLVPADERTYRAAVGAALTLERKELAVQWCTRGLRARFGGYHADSHSGLFMGVGLRKLALEVDAAPALATVIVTNAGVQMDERRTYDFLLPEDVDLSELRLHLGLLPGVRVGLYGITLYGHEGSRRISPKDLTTTSLFGYHPSSEEFLSVGRDGDVLTFRARNGGFGTAQRVDFDLSFRRLPIASTVLCGEAASG